MISENQFVILKNNLTGTLYTDALHKNLYATDASVYRKLPLAVAYPKDVKDIQIIINFASKHSVGIIPRTAGTSLAGQCVGAGIVVDVSKHFTNILEIHPSSKTVVVEPGVIRDELNLVLEKHSLFFGPNTSTSNRCMIGGMVGNNSSGTTSIQYGVTRDKVLAMDVVLSDGSLVTFKEITAEEFIAKTKLSTLEGKIYKTIYNNLKDKTNQSEILNEFPKPEIHRRNTGYALDELIHMQPFTNGQKFNMCKLLSGSEGTLAFTTKITLQLDELPPKHSVMVAAHFKSIADCCNTVAPVMNHNLYSCEMMDKVILDCTKNNLTQQQNRFFIEGDPEAILLLELREDTEDALEKAKEKLLDTLEQAGISYANPCLYKDNINKALELRKAGLGLLGNMVGDKKAVACIEDTAVAIEDLANYIDDFSKLMDKHQQQAVYYAHAGAGELHLRPVLNLKSSEDVALFEIITLEVAKLVKQYRGSMSGEHGDGIVRSGCIELMIGSNNYQLLKKIKNVFDPNNIMNPGKIVDFKPMTENLRYQPNREEPNINTILDFSDSQGILRAAEKCNGSGDCRKTQLSKGAMCPSYHATKDEKHTTRGRANVLREFLTNSQQSNKFNHKELKEVFDLCLSCKACASECPSNVDVASLKAEFLYQYQQSNGASLRDKIFAYNTKLNKWNSKVAGLSNFILNKTFVGNVLKKSLGISKERSFPKIYSFSFNKIIQNTVNKNVKKTKIVLFIDEFTQYLDVEVGKDAIMLLQTLGYEVELFYGESGRTFISKGFLKQAKHIANKNIESLKDKVTSSCVLIGLEPSAILSFRDEYIRLANTPDIAKKIASNTYTIEEFLASEINKGEVNSNQFTSASRVVKIHNHCHQKALSNQKHTFDMLNVVTNYQVTIINSGCCGMAGSFGYEKEHYNVSMQVGELQLFPAVRKTSKETLIAANGTSCRHQIYDGTQRIAKHPVTILREALA
jgi:FAD/FMN-containing dehydrogenase/Fe-S oxidoreductase